MSAELARKAITAAGLAVAPEAAPEELAAYGATVSKHIGKRTPVPAPPSHLTVQGRQAAANAREDENIARAKRRSGSAPPRPATSRVAAATAPVINIGSNLGQAATGGLVSGDSAVGRIIGATFLGLIVLVIGGMFTKKNWLIGVEPGVGAVTSAAAATAYSPQAQAEQQLAVANAEAYSYQGHLP